MGSDGSGKVCMLCKADCSNRPRQKDGAGRYACKDCLDRRAAGAPEAQPLAGGQRKKEAGAVAVAEPPENDVLNTMLIEIAEAKAKGCGQCGAPMKAEAIICTKCGFNRKLGTRLHTAVGVEEVKASRKDGSDEYDKKRVSARRDLASRPARVVLGALIGAAIGTGIWGFLVYNINFDFRLLACIVGGATGTGTAIGAAGYAGKLTGLWAVAVTIGALLVGRFVIIDKKIEQVVTEVTKTVQSQPMTAFDVQLEIAMEVHDDFESKGIPMRWPPGKGFENARWLQDLPKNVSVETQNRWNALGPAGQNAAIRAAEAARDAELKAFADEAKAATKEVFQSTLSVGSILRYFLAICLAFFVGAGGKVIE